MFKKQNNYAYIDSQNLHLGVQSLGWELDYKKFRRYLTEKYKVATAYLFIGYIPQNQDLYSSLQKSGYILKFKPVDGDFYSTVKFLYDRGKLGKVVSPYMKTCSSLLKKTAKEKIVFISNLQKKLEYKNKKHRFRTKP